MAKREKQEKDQWDRLLEQISFHGLTQNFVLGQAGGPRLRFYHVITL